MFRKLLSGSLSLLMVFALCAPVYGQERVLERLERDVPAECTSESCQLPELDELTYEVYKLPKPDYFRSEDGVAQDACYTFKTFKKLLKIDNDLRVAEIIVVAQHNRIVELNLAGAELTLAMDLSETALKLMMEDRDRISKKWEADNLAKHEAENKPTFGSWIPWALSGALAAFSVGLLIAIASEASD